MLGSTNGKTDPVAKLQKDLTAAQKSRAGHDVRLATANERLPQAEDAVTQNLELSEPGKLKAARLARQELRDEAADMRAALDRDNAEIARIESEIAAIIRKRRQEEKRDAILALVPLVEEANTRLDEALANAAEVYGKALVKSADFGGAAAAVHDFREPLRQAIAHALPTLSWLAQRALQEIRCQLPRLRRSLSLATAAGASRSRRRILRSAVFDFSCQTIGQIVTSGSNASAASLN